MYVALMIVLALLTMAVALVFSMLSRGGVFKRDADKDPVQARKQSNVAFWVLLIGFVVVGVMYLGRLGMQQRIGDDISLGDIRDMFRRSRR